jgi:hypothetical protein
MRHARALGVALGKVHHAVRHVAAKTRAPWGRAPRPGAWPSCALQTWGWNGSNFSKQSGAASRPRCCRRSARPRWRWCRCRSRGRTAARRRRTLLPAAGGDHGGGQGFLQRGVALVLAPAALEQRLARGVDVQRGLIGRQVHMDAHVGPARVHIGALAALVAKAVGHRVLDLERGEVQAFQRAVLGGHFDLEGLAAPAGCAGSAARRRATSCEAARRHARSASRCRPGP